MKPLLDLMDRCTELGIRLCPRELAAIEYGSQVLVVLDMPKGGNAVRLMSPESLWLEVLLSIQPLHKFDENNCLGPDEEDHDY